jgi:hypothetical protein
MSAVFDPRPGAAGATKFEIRSNTIEVMPAIAAQRYPGALVLVFGKAILLSLLVCIQAITSRANLFDMDSMLPPGGLDHKQSSPD